MERFAEYNLTPWTKDELVDLLDEYPNLLTMSEGELQKLARERYNTAQGYIDRANRLENEADAIIKYCMEKYINPRVKK
jgi:hypothetical protein